METNISGFHTSFYIPAIQKLAFRSPRVRILGTNHCGEMWLTAFKRHELFQDVLCCRNYSERVVANFANQIKSEYYVVNISVSIDGIALEHLGQYHRQISIHQHYYVNGMHYFTLFYITIANRMLLLLLHTANDWFHCSRTKKYLQHH